MSYTIYINNTKYTVEHECTILDVAKVHQIDIPTLCYLKSINAPAQCRMCVVEVSFDTSNIGHIKPITPGKLMTACNTKIVDGMIIYTHSDAVINSRKTTLELLLSMHDDHCLSCSKNTKCKLQKLCDTLNINRDVEKMFTPVPIDNSNHAIVRDVNKCILCGKCVSICDKNQGCNAVGKINRGIHTYIGCTSHTDLQHSSCVGCGQCTLVCPVGALSLDSDIDKALSYLTDPSIITIAMVAPSVRVAVGDDWGYPLGEFVEGKLVTALKQLGFDYVYDVNNGADFTIIEEGNELVKLIESSGILNGEQPHEKTFPLFTSCCPAWFNYVEKNFPDYKNNLSSTKSPNELLGSLVRYYIEKNPDLYHGKSVKIISIMPCTAKKREILVHGNIDCVITTRELNKMLVQYGIKLNTLPNSTMDTPFGEYSGAGLIFGSTGGVTEAALRYAMEKLTNQHIDSFPLVRSSNGIKEVSLDIDGVSINLAIVHGLRHAQKLMQDIQSGKKTYHFVEVMACPGGCVNGGGQPIVDYDKIDVEDVINARAQSLYNNDSKMTLKTSQENKSVHDIYENLLHNDPELIHKLMHYTK